MDSLDTDYKEIDRNLILKYIKSFDGIIKVDDIIEKSCANRLRVYPLLNELVKQGLIMESKHDMFGAPIEVIYIG
jgi:DNA-binding IclR family transcriptional regulator